MSRGVWSVSNLRWTLSVARRFLANRRMTQSRLPTVLSTAGIAVGVTAMIVVLSVMNGFQMGFIEDILEIRSYHVRIEGDAVLDRSTMARLRDLPLLASIGRFREVRTLGSGRFSEYKPIVLRGIEPVSISGDTGLRDQIEMMSGGFELGPVGSVVLGSQLADEMDAAPGSPLDVVTLHGSLGKGLRPATQSLVVTGVFESGYYEIDSTLAFCSIGTTELVAGPSEGASYGVKLTRRYRDDEAMARMSAVLDGEGYRLESWREFNRAFFGALRVEKLLMILLLSLIFLVVAFNIGHSLSRSIAERREAISVLKALGGTPQAVRTVFVLQGALIGVFGAFAGTAIGLLVVTRIDEFFAFLERAAAALSSGPTWLAGVAGDGDQVVPVFAPSMFYMTGVPVRIVPLEVLLTVVAAILASVAAAFLASRRLSEIQPQRVLRYE